MDETPTEQLKFRRALAMKMLENNIRDDGVNIGSPRRHTKRSRLSKVCEHKLQTRPKFTGEWKTVDNWWSKVKTEYMKTKCAHCSKKVRTYCKCNQQMTLCSECYADHVSAHDNTYSASTN